MGTDLRVLLVDDSRIFRAALQSALEVLPWVRVAGSVFSGEKALALLETTPVDLVLLDMEMPGLCGLDTLHRIQKFNSSGAFQRAWGEDVVSAGPGNTGGFEICVDANNDTCKVGVASPPALAGEMNFPNAVATDAVGNVYVSDSNHQRVQKFSSAGAWDRAWGRDVASAGPGDTGTGFEVCTAADVCKTGVSGGLAGAFFDPDGLAVDGSGFVYVTVPDTMVARFRALPPLTELTLRVSLTAARTRYLATPVADLLSVESGLDVP